MVSKASDDLPLPLIPVITTNLFLGMEISIFLRLCSLAPNTSIASSVTSPDSKFFFAFVIKKEYKFTIKMFDDINYRTGLFNKINTKRNHPFKILHLTDQNLIYANFMPQHL